MNINNWSFSKPTQEGLYLRNYGDVVTSKSIRAMKLCLHAGDLVMPDYGLVSESGDGYKWIKLDLDELNKLGNEGKDDGQ